VKIRYGDFETITRSETLDAATDRSDLLRGAASALFERWAREGFRPVRLIGGSVSGLRLMGGGQGELFGNAADERARRLDRATDAIRAKYGADVIQRGIDDAGERRKGRLDA